MRLPVHEHGAVSTGNTTVPGSVDPRLSDETPIVVKLVPHLTVVWSAMQPERLGHSAPLYIDGARMFLGQGHPYLSIHPKSRRFVA